MLNFIFCCFLFQNFLDAFAEAADSPYGCLLVHGKVAVATKKWWSLAAKELVLISMLLSSLLPCSSRDVPVFLPVVSPNVSFTHNDSDTFIKKFPISMEKYFKHKFTIYHLALEESWQICIYAICYFIKYQRCA